MKILIFSGGSGSKGLQESFWKLGLGTDNLINLYDDGLSTGIVRQAFKKPILGPSDLRKNQLLKHYLQYGDTDLYKLLSCRFTLADSTKLEQYCYSLIDSYNLSDVDNNTLKYAVNIFIREADYKSIAYDDFAFANIIYSAFFYQFGVIKTHDILKEVLKIENNVYINSEEVFTLNAMTQDSSVIRSEGEIVSWDNPKNKILSVYSDNGKTPYANGVVINAIKSADLIILSPGTQWSSLIPTYLTPNIVTTLQSHQKVYLVLNNKNDKDMTGYTNDEFLGVLKKYLGFIPSLVYNKDSEIAAPSIPVHLEDSFGKGFKHDCDKLVRVILKDYYKSIITKERKYLFDFDYTLFDYKNPLVSNSNIQLFNQLSKTYNMSIVTGNSYQHLINNGIDKNCLCYTQNGMVKRNNNQTFTLDKYMMDKEETEEIDKILKILELDKFKVYIIEDINRPVMVRIKNVYENRESYVKELNSVLPKGLWAYSRGIATIEIHKKNITKMDYISSEENLENVLYLGDDNLGNDHIFFRLFPSVKITNVEITNIFLEAMVE